MAKKLTSPALFHKATLDALRQLKQVGVDEFRSHVMRPGIDDHRWMVSGTNPMGKDRLRQLRALGHSFGRRSGGRGRGSLKALPLHIVTGKLRRSLLHRQVMRAGSLVEIRVGFTAPHARYVLSRSGTARMRTRGAQTELQKRYRARIRAWRDAVKLKGQHVS